VFLARTPEQIPRCAGAVHGGARAPPPRGYQACRAECAAVPSPAGDRCIRRRVAPVTSSGSPGEGR
jgi:hypothetical protein